MHEAILVVLLVGIVNGFYLPGVAPREYEDGSQVQLKVNKLTSSKRQLPYRYYSLPFCRPSSIVKKVENLGEVLSGDAIENSPYDIRMRVNSSCQVLCRRGLTKKEKNLLRTRIDEEYLVNMIVDGFPAGTRFVTPDGTELLLNGFPIGGLDRVRRYYLHNHLTLNLKYHQRPEAYEGFRIVGFEVIPSSIDHLIEQKDSKTITSCIGPKSAEREKFILHHKSKVTFTYDVQWTNSSRRWASRWDNYLDMKGPSQVHWLAIISSTLIILCMSVVVAMILLRTTYRDIVKYNEVPTSEEAQEETGWKLIHGDVFRAPEWPIFLSASVGCGVQLLGMSIVTLAFAVGGFLSPANRGGLLQSLMVVFTVMGTVAGYVAARLYKLFEGEQWMLMTMTTACFYPGIIFGLFFLLNLIIWGEKSSGSVPFVSLFVLLVLWFGISAPLVYVGSQVGSKRSVIQVPTTTAKIERLIPEHPVFMNKWALAALGGILPFSAVFTELFFVLSSIWMHQFYYMFGFLALTLIILIIHCAEVSITLVYFQLTAEDHKWWWQSFANTGASGAYLFFYSIIYFNTRLETKGFIPTFLYVGYMLIMSLMFGLLTGTIGLVSSFYFVKAIYSSIKVD